METNRHGSAAFNVCDGFDELPSSDVSSPWRSFISDWPLDHYD